MPNPSFLSRRLRLPSHLLSFFISHSNITFLSLPVVHNLSIRLKSFLSCRWGPHCVCYLSQQGGWKGESLMEEGWEEGIVWHTGRETETMIGEGGPWGVEWIYLLLRCRSFVCACVYVCVELTTQRPSLLYCCLSLKQKLSGGDRLAASLISALFPPVWDPLLTQTQFWSVTNKF